MKRRSLILACGAWAALAGGRGWSQAQNSPRLIAMLLPSTREFTRPQLDAFTARLKELGHVEGRNILIEPRFADGSIERLPALARELVALKPAVIVASTPAPAAAAKNETSTVPIVFIAVENPEELGFVASLGRPGGNLTGVTFRGAAMATKLRELVRESLPDKRRVAVLSVDDPATLDAVLASRKYFVEAGFEAEYFFVKQRETYASAFARIARWRAEILWVGPWPLFVSDARELGGLAAKARLPLVGTRRAFTNAGGLLSYDNDLKEDYRRAAGYVDRVLKGAKPGELPVEQPERYHLTVNQRAARALGIKIPQPVLIRADEVIE